MAQRTFYRNHGSRCGLQRYDATSGGGVYRNNGLRIVTKDHIIGELVEYKLRQHATHALSPEIQVGELSRLLFLKYDSLSANGYMTGLLLSTA